MARNSTVIANQVITGTGSDTAGRPSIAFGDTDTGFYESIDDKLHVTLGGTERFVFSGANFVKADGSAIADTTISGGSILDSHINSQANIVLNKLSAGVTGQILHYNTATRISGLAVSTSGLYLMTQGAGQIPVWTNVTAPNYQRRYICLFSVDQSISGATDYYEVGNHAIPSGSLERGKAIFIRGQQSRGCTSAAGTVKISLIANSIANDHEDLGSNASYVYREVRYINSLASSTTKSLRNGFTKIGTAAQVEQNSLEVDHTTGTAVFENAIDIKFYARHHGTANSGISGAYEVLY